MKINKIQKKNNKYKIVLEDNTIIETYDEITGEKKYSYKPIEGEYNDWLLGWKKIN